jgi:hypothetical protein
MLHAFISPEDDILKIENNINPDVATKPGYRWLPVVDIARPSYDPDLEVAEQIVVLNEDNITRNWVIRNKTQAEIDGDRINKINTIDPVIFSILFYMNNEIRKLNDLELLNEQEYRDTLKDLF